MQNSTTKEPNRLVISVYDIYDTNIFGLYQNDDENLNNRASLEMSANTVLDLVIGFESNGFKIVGARAFMPKYYNYHDDDIELVLNYEGLEITSPWQEIDFQKFIEAFKEEFPLEVMLNCVEYVYEK